jgi:putative membrane protein
MTEQNKNNVVNKKRSIVEYVKLSFAGFAMGVANVIPGVSGGTMAFILGIYEELIDSIRQFACGDTIKKALTFKIKDMYNNLPWPFLAALGVGVLLAFATAAKLFTWLLINYPALTFAFFFGLVAASILTVLKKVKKWSISRIVMLIVGAVAAFLVVTLVPVETPNNAWFSFFGGMIVICAMILPGISGSFLLLVLGQYKYVWGAVAALASGKITSQALTTVICVGAGCVIGLGSFVHLLNWLFKKFHDLTVATLIGFMVGSMWKLWPWKKIIEYSVKTKEGPVRVAADAISQYQGTGAKIKPLVEKNLFPSQLDGMFWAATGLIVLGFVIVIIMEYAATRKENEEA